MGEVRPLQALVLGAVVVCLLPRLHYPPSSFGLLQLGCLWPLSWFSHQGCPAGHWAAARVAMGG